MSSSFLILFYISLACLVVIIGRRVLFPTPQASTAVTIFDIPVIAQGVRNFIMWIPRVLRATLVNIAGGISMAIHNIGHRLERYRHRHESESEE